MSNSPLVSIIIPVYNAGEYLRPCLDSLVNQTLRDIEIVCVLDCPTDGSDKIVEEYAAKDDRFLVIRNEKNLHISESRNVGIRVAHGEFIGFSDHDDLHELDMYENLCKQTKGGDVDAVFGGVVYLNKSERIFFPSCCENVVQPSTPAYIYNLYNWSHNALVTPNLYRKSILVDNQVYFEDTRKYCAEDVLFYMAVLAHIRDAKRVVGVKYSGYYHVFTGSNTAYIYEYTNIVQNIAFIDFSLTYLNKSQETRPIGKEIAHFLMLKLYSAFRYEIKKNGFIKAVRTLKKAVLNKNCRDAIVNARIHRPEVPRLPSPKRIFFLWLKIYMWRRQIL